MYSSEFRDKVYEQQNMPPRRTLEHKESATNRLDKYLPGNLKGKKILDYGCGDGHIGEHLLQKGADVDFAEISSNMVNLLKKTYKNNISKILKNQDHGGNVNVFLVETPDCLPVENENYDYIITWALFHHINPDKWKEFLDKFGKLLKKGGEIIVYGRDATDIVLEQDESKGHVTGQPSYAINNLPDFLDSEIFEIKETGLQEERLSIFDIPRVLRYFIVRRV